MTMDEFTITRSAKTSPSTAKFQFNETFANRLCTVEEALRRDVFKVVDLKVKVVQKQQGTQLVYKNGNARRKSDSYIADTTESIKLALWEDLTDHVHAGKSYHFKNLTVRIFEDKKFLNSNENTVIEEIEQHM